MNNLPKNWTIATLNDVAKLTSGGTPLATKKEYYENGTIPWLVIGDLTDSFVEYSEKYITEIALKESNAKLLQIGTLLIAMYGSIGKLGITKIECATNQAIASIIELYGIDKFFLFYLLLYKRPFLMQLGKGGTQKNISLAVLNSLEIPLPPLAEQGRIVAKIEELFAGIDAGIENLKAVKNQIALYRQSVLKSAFDFDASTFSALKNLIDKVRYGTSKKCSTEENVNSMPVYRIPNIDFKKGVLDKTDLKFASFDDSEKSSLMLKSGDILIIRSNGSLNLVGRAALVYNTDTNGLYAGYLMRLRIKDTEKLLPKFLLHFLNSGKARAYIEEKAKSTSGVNNINSEEISDLQIPVPTLAEQEKIVAEIESRFERADALETAVDRALNDAEKLKQAVLKKAFSGELVPQNPDDEPASVLLDRIRAARASEQRANPKKGKQKR